MADDAYLTIQSIYDKEQPAVLLAEPTRHVKSVLGRLAAAAGAAAITDVTAFEDGGALSLYFGGVGERVRKAAGDVAFYTVVPGTFADAEPAGSAVAETVAWIAPGELLRLVSSRPSRRAAPICSRPRRSWPAAAGSPRSPSSTSPAPGRQDRRRSGLLPSLDRGRRLDAPEHLRGRFRPHAHAEGVCGLRYFRPDAAHGGLQLPGAVFAINKDKNAPVFKQCDYGLVGDIKRRAAGP